MVLSYLVGDILFAYVIGKVLYGVDVRQYGSHNLGGTNVYRTLGPLAAVLVIAGDVGKGALAVWLGGLIAGHQPLVQLLCGIAVIAGHNWPAFLGFQGGRGIGTSLGVLLGLMPKAAIVPALTFVLTVALTRYVSLGSILAAVVFPFTVYWLGYPGLYLAGSLVLTGFALYRHVPNMKRLLAGKEFKLGQKIEVGTAPDANVERRAAPGGERKAPGGEGKA
ncbi:MAG TPA: glycerol-3-phosphate 1-O-acyltransferase PlsY [Firmicutes bacterium]|nr:glycerol-3-phosphate 1-O-acyltransferase PlsY [Bacillota bacterium]